MSERYRTVLMYTKNVIKGVNVSKVLNKCEKCGKNCEIAILGSSVRKRLRIHLADVSLASPIVS